MIKKWQQEDSALTIIESPIAIDREKKATAEKWQAHPYRSVITHPFFLYMFLTCTTFGLITEHFLILPIIGALFIVAVPIAGRFFRRHGEKILENGPNRLEENLAEEVADFNKRVEYYYFLLSGSNQGFANENDIAEFRQRLRAQRTELQRRIGLYQWLLQKPKGTPYSDCIGELKDCAGLDDLDELSDLSRFRQRLALEDEVQSDLTASLPRQLKK